MTDVPGRRAVPAIVVLATLGAVSLGAILGACGDAPGPTDGSPPVASGSPLAPPTSSGEATLGVPSPAPSGSSGTPEPRSVSQDPALLDILPADVDGVAVGAEPDAFAAAAADPDFAANVEAAAFAVVVDGGDLASGVVARLRPGVWSEGFFRDWRDSYDAGACGRAGGVAGNAQAELGGRTTYITTCAGGLRVYHVRVDQGDLVVSLISIGERRFGERLMEGLRP